MLDDLQDWLLACCLRMRMSDGVVRVYILFATSGHLGARILCPVQFDAGVFDRKSFG